MTINNNPTPLTPNFDLFLNLTPPGSEGDPFNNLATDMNGVPIGEQPNSESIARLFGYSSQDTIGSSLDQVLGFANQLNISTQISANSTQTYLNTLNPTTPSLPPINSYIEVNARSLENGFIGGLQVSGSKTAVYANPIAALAANPDAELSSMEEAAISSHNIGVNVNEARDNLNVSTDSISFRQISGGNKWLAGNVYVAFLVEFMEMQRLLMRNKEVQGQVELNGMNLVVELANTTADIIMNVAKTQQMIHIVSAVMAAVSICITIGAFTYAMKGAQPNTKGEMTNPKAFEIASMISSMGSQVEKLATSAAQAATDITMAEKEGRKEILQAYRTIAQRQMDKASETFKASEDAIVQLLQALDRIRESLQQAVSAALRK